MASVAGPASQSRRLNLSDFKPIFNTYLNPTATFLSHLGTLINTEEANHIQDLITNKTREVAVNTFLLKLERKQHNEPGIFTVVVRALEQSEQTHIAEMLQNGQKVPDANTRRVRYLIEVFAIVLNTVNPIEMLPYLRCLSDEERGQVQSCVQNTSDQRGAQKLFSLLVLKASTEMMTQLIEALKKTSKGCVAEQLEDLQKSDNDDCNDIDCCEEYEETECHNNSAANHDHSIDDDVESTPLNLPWHASETGSSSHPQAENDTPPKKLVLRSYQRDLAKASLVEHGSNNNVVVAPTGSGKTVVAVAIAQDLIENRKTDEACSNQGVRPGKVVFLVNQKTLVDQQTEQFQQYLGSSSVIGISGETARALELNAMLQQKSVMVMTAQVLVNALQNNVVSLADIGLLILDECHNCQKGTPYNKIMSIYRDMVIENKEPRPQILGMSASLDIGQAKSQDQAIEKVWQMCANLDVRVISMVTSAEGKRELKAHLNIPVEYMEEVAGRIDDMFLKDVASCMKRIEEEIYRTPGMKEIIDSNPQLRTSGNYGTQPYEQWIVQLQTDIAEKVKDYGTRRKMIACTDHLKAYNGSLYINRNIRTKDAVSKLEAFLAEQERKEDGFDETDNFLVKLLKGNIPKLKVISDDPKSSNPVLNKLGDILIKAFQTTAEVPEKRGILFTQRREFVEALVTWIKETEELQFLNPGKLIGSGRYDGMTQKTQVDVLKKLREGDHKLLVATSVAQEGLDITKCNVVVQYNCVANVVAQIQARGRNRAKGGQFFMVFDEQQKLSDKTLTNAIRERMMQQATDIVHGKLLLEPQQSRRKIMEIQITDQRERTQKRTNEARRQKQLVTDRVTLTCRKCGDLACCNHDIRCIKDAHRIVISDVFKDRYDTKPNPKYPKLIDELDMRMTLVCAKCKSDWGTQAIYQGMEVPLMNIQGFVAEYPNGVRKRVKKWKDVMFQVEPIAYTDLDKVLNTETTVSAEE